MSLWIVSRRVFQRWGLCPCHPCQEYHDGQIAFLSETVENDADILVVKGGGEVVPVSDELAVCVR